MSVPVGVFLSAYYFHSYILRKLIFSTIKKKKKKQIIISPSCIWVIDGTKAGIAFPG